MSNKTELHDTHIKMNGKMVDFTGWTLPIHYGSQINEHKIVRSDAGMFDVSHMMITDIKGKDAKPYLLHILANNIDRLKEPGKALYSCILNETAGIIDDLIIYYINDTHYRMITNAGTRDKNKKWFAETAKEYDIAFNTRDDLATIAIQGPNARKKTCSILPSEVQQQAEQLPPFSSLSHKNWFIARTGYTGEDGFEVILPNEEIVDFWNKLHQAGVTPVGLGARDTLRLEAAMSLYGTDMDEKISPLECGLSWTIAWQPVERDFIGRRALTKIRSQIDNQVRIGILLPSKGILRNGQKVYMNNKEIGFITSGSYSPIIGKSIALARINNDSKGEYSVDIRGKKFPVQKVKLPFIMNGKDNSTT